MKSYEIAYKVAWLSCGHKKSGMPPCRHCNSKLDQELEVLNIKALISVAKYLEPSTEDITKITPTSWCAAYDIVKLVFARIS